MFLSIIGIQEIRGKNPSGHSVLTSQGSEKLTICALFTSLIVEKSVRISSTWSRRGSSATQVRYLRHVALNLPVDVSRLQFYAFLQDTCEHREVGEEDEKDEE